MQKLKYLYLPGSKLSFFLLLIFISLPIYPFQLSENNLPYFHTLSDSDLNNLEIKENLFHSAKHGTNIIRLKAALKLSELGIEQKDFKIVAEVCKSLLEDGYTEIALFENLFDTYYLQEDFKSLVLTVNKYLAADIYSKLKSSPKIEFYIFLAQLYSGSDTVTEHFREFIIENTVSEFTVDAYFHIKKFEISIPASTVYLANFKMQLFKKEYYSAGRTMIQILNSQKEIIISTLERGYIVDSVDISSVILDEMYKTASSTGQKGELLGLIEELLLIPELSGYEPGEVYSYELLSRLYETAGYLLRRNGDYSKAADMFLTGLSFTSVKKYEKILWYWYNSLIRYSPELAVSQINLLTEKWTDPDYFTDVLEELATYFIQQGQWSVINKLLDAIELTGPDESISKYAYLTARAGIESYISINKKEIIRLMTLSYNSGYGIASGLYYRILAGNYLKIFDIRQLPWVFNRTVNRYPVPAEPGEDGSSELIFGFLEYEQPVEAYKYLMDNPFSNFGLVRRTALELSEGKNFAKSIRLVNRYSRIDGFNLDISDLKLIYPDAYNSEILKISDKEALEWYVFTALVREESHFQERVVSSAGAIGLSQLMPATAADVAGRLRFTNYNLRDANTNLMFGGWYLGNLIKRTDIMSDALFAYNGGLTRVRRWREEYSSLPDDLFLEAVPYKETSHYGRKLLVSSVVYGYLYEGIQPGEIINLFYRN
ncbi:MAG: lytic transglycosylase domain-containing protein [Spirochaetales bacterium]|nr:lytic transglycosylase domain-containing protein [Spirochaetales bacterium]